ncbi:COG4705 family protein [Nostoc sp.]|uniref:COG4705 family protein n=1 Tax=Nostoc sp. TaxID=1180 RepID=UPI002FFBBD9E
MSKLPQITAFFWIMKICATTLGETAGDLLSMTLNVGYAISSMILIGVFLATLVTQLISKSYNPLLYWTVILSTSTAGTTMSDFMDRTLGLGYATGTTILVTILLAILVFWRFSVGSLSVNNIKTPKLELLYWTTILFSNTLGTALGDFLADSSGLGFAGGALLIAGLLALVLAAHYYTQISQVILFWIAFVLTRPFGATLGDILTKSHAKGGLDFGTIGSSIVLVSILGVCILFTTLKHKKPGAARPSNDE